ncbi:MAG TPA: hypothetical protein V6C86_27190 [Oculatellaceae cyanobacterium]
MDNKPQRDSDNESQSQDRRKETCRSCEYERVLEGRQDVWGMVTNPLTSGDELETQSRGAQRLVAERIAEHPNALATTLERLSYHPAAEVRAAVAENLNTPTHIIFALTHDSNPDVRYSIAENHNCPTEALELLTEDENPYVAYRAHTTLLRIGPQRRAQQLAFPNVSKKVRQQVG